MRRRWAGAFGAFVVLGAFPAAVDAQSRTCRQTLASDFRRLVDTQGQEIVYFRQPVRFLCTGNVLLEADSAVLNRGASTVELVGHVVYRDSTRELRSEWANYLGRADQLLARGSMVLRDLDGGAVIRGEQLNYLRATDNRPISRMIVTGGRPHALIPPRRQPAGQPGPGTEDARPAPDDLDAPAEPTPPPPALDAPVDTAPPTEVWGDRLELEGESVFRAQGNVDVQRGTTVGGGETAVFDQASERMTLTTAAFVRSESYRLDGDRIDGFLEGDGLREVRSEGRARVTSEDLNVRAPRIRIGFARGELERLEAWTPDPATPGPRAHADARDFRIRGDSIDAQADSLGIRELRAIGGAYGERELTIDDPDAPAAAAAALPAAISRDWIQGDTILGFFTREPVLADPTELPADDAPDEERTEVVLERIVVVGGEDPALSLYRMQQDGAGGGRPAINFMKATRIILFMEQGEVARVEAEGPIEGLYLDPTGEPGIDTEERSGGIGGERRER